MTTPTELWVCLIIQWSQIEMTAPLPWHLTMQRSSKTSFPGAQKSVAQEAGGSRRRGRIVVAEHLRANWGDG